MELFALFNNYSFTSRLTNSYTRFSLSPLLSLLLALLSLSFFFFFFYLSFFFFRSFIITFFSVHFYSFLVVCSVPQQHSNDCIVEVFICFNNSSDKSARSIRYQQAKHLCSGPFSLLESHSVLSTIFRHVFTILVRY